MNSQEYTQLLKALPKERLLEFVKLFFQYVYKGDFAFIRKAEWDNYYILSIQRTSRSFDRCILVIDHTCQLNVVLNSSLPTISSQTDKLFHKVDCFCLSKCDDKESIEEHADIDYGLTLIVHDITSIENGIQSKKDLREFLAPSNISVTGETRSFNRKDKVLYDIFTTSKKIADVKISFIGSYIQFFLLEQGPLSYKDLNSRLKQVLPNLSDQAFDDTIKNAISDDIIFYDNGVINLDSSYEDRLKELRALSFATEQRLLQQFDECLMRYGVLDSAKDILSDIVELYRINNNRELSNLSTYSDNDNTDKRIVAQLFQTLTNKGVESSSLKQAVQDILAIISDSEYLNKMSTTTLFTSLFNSDSLEDYLGTQKRIVFLDTQVLLQLLCVDYLGDVPYNDSLYEAGQILSKQLSDSIDYLELYTTKEYVREVSNHIYEAFELGRFIHLDYLKDFGPSKNIFYNFYLFLEEYDDRGYDSYEDYFKNLLNTEIGFSGNYNDFVLKVDQLVADLLDGMNITIKDVDSFDNIDSYKIEYDRLIEPHPKSNKARENDVKCLYYLSDSNNFINVETTLVDQPFFITLDSTILPLRNMLVNKYQRSFFYIYPPTKFANRLSVMNMKLDSRKINYDIICLAETNFKASNDSISLLDLMSKFFNRQDVHGLRLPRLIAQIKREEQNMDLSKAFAMNNSKNMPIDVVLSKLMREYKKKGKRDFLRFTRLLEIDELSENISEKLKQCCEQVIKTGDINKSMYNAFDILIERNIDKINY